MSNSVKNIITILIAALALAGIATVIVMASITIEPAMYGKYLDASGEVTTGSFMDYDAVNIYYWGERLPVAMDNSLQGEGKDSGKYTISDVLGKLNFSLFSTAIQFNYNFGVSFYDDSKISNNQMSASKLKSVIEEYKSVETNGYVFEISNKSVQNLELSDFWGRKTVIQFDTIVFNVTASSASDWPSSIEAYIFVNENLYSTSDMPGENASSYKYYRIKFYGKTAELISTLDGIYDIDSSLVYTPPETPSEEGEEGEESA